jgi:hypothetical protein
MRRMMVEELAFAEVAALRKLKVWTTAMNNLRSSQEMRSTRAGPTGCSIFATGRCVTFLADASASHAVETVTASNVHSLLSKVLGLYATVATTAEWIEATSQWPIANGLGCGAESHEAG